MASETAPTDYRVQPGWGAAIFAVVAYLVIVVGTWKLSGVAYDEFFDTAGKAFKSAVLSLVLGSIFLVAFLAYARWDWIWRDARRLSMGPFLSVLPILMVVGLLTRFAGLDWAEIDGGVIAAIFCAGVLVGFAEETLFRGIFLRAMRVGGRDEAAAAVLTTVAFGLFHLPNILVGGGPGTFAQVAIAALSGFGLYLTRRGFGWIVPAMLLHGFWDMSTFAAADHAKDGNIFAGISQGLFFFNLVVAIAAIVVVWRRDRSTRWQEEGPAIVPAASLA